MNPPGRCLLLKRFPLGTFRPARCHLLVALSVWLGAVAVCFAPPPAPDLKLTITDAPDPVSVGELLTLHLSVTNQGSASASGVSLVTTLSPNATFFSGIASQGGVTHSNGIVTGALGSLAVGASATVDLKVTPGAVGHHELGGCE